MALEKENNKRREKNHRSWNAKREMVASKKKSRIKKNEQNENEINE